MGLPNAEADAEAQRGADQHADGHPRQSDGAHGWMVTRDLRTVNLAGSCQPPQPGDTGRRNL